MSEANEPLSEREIEILRLVATGASNKEIALALSISPNTVKVHLRNIFTKIGVVSRTEATLYALKTGLVTPDLPPAAEDDAGAETLLPTIQDLNPLPEQSGFSRRTWIIITSAALLVAVVALVLWFSRPAPAAVQPTTSVTLAVAPRWQTAEKLPQPHSGAAYATYSGALYLFGGQTAQGVSAATLIYSDSQGWTNGKDKPTPVAQAKAVLIGERIYLAGGSGADGTPVNVLEMYDPRADAWESRAPLPAGISQYALAAYEGSLYLFGGWDGSATLDSVYRYSPTDDRWEARAALPQPLAFAAAVTEEGRILISGGRDTDQAYAASWYYYPGRDDENETPWEAAPDLPQPRFAHSAIMVANSAYIMGGSSQVTAPAADGLPPIMLPAGSTDWQVIAAPAQNLGSQVSLLALGNYLHVIGGDDVNGPSDRHLVYQALYTVAVPIISNNATTPEP